jgi:hypothetical protein
MPAKRLTARYPDDTIIVVPIPLVVAHANGCRPNAVICLQSVDDEIRVMPDTIRTEALISARHTPNATNMWETCGQWWKARGSNAG